MAVLTVTSGAGDGNIYVDNGGTWATVRGATSGTAQPTSDPTNVYASQLTSRCIGRIFLPFDTSSIPNDAIIVSAVLTFTIGTVYSASGTLHVVQTSQAASTTLVANDYDNLAFTSGGSVAVSSTGTKTITLNATGLGWINVNGVTYLGLIEDHDLTNTDPTTTDHRFSVYMSENATPGNRPSLEIVYEPVSTQYLKGRRRQRIDLTGVSAG